MGATLHGIVRDEEGRPVTGATVSARRKRLEQVATGGNIYLDDSTYKSSQTDTEGTFTLKGVGQGEHIFEVRCRGYDLLVQNLEISEQTARQDLEFVLRRSGRIAGIVTDEKDTPIASATVRLTAYKPLGYPTVLLPDEDRYKRLSNSKGEFAFEKLATEGFYDLSVEHQDFAPAIFPLVSPGTLRQVCRLERGASIRGAAVFIDRPTTPAAITIAAQASIKGTTVTREAKSDATGAFALVRLPYGSYKLFCISPDIASEPLEGIKCERDKPSPQAVLEVYEKCLVKGRVLDAASDTPISNAKVRAECTYGLLQPRKREFRAVTDATGGFELQALPAGLVRLQAEAQGYVPSASSGASAQTFTLLPGERKSDVSLRLGRGGSVDGFVLDHLGRGVEGAEVQLFVSATTPRRINVDSLKGKTDASGYFKLWGIDVGEHLQLYASAQKTGYARARSKLIDLTASKPYASTQIVLTPGASVSGRVTDERKLPIADAQVEFTSEEFPMDPSYKPRSVQTAADGSYSISFCTPGKGRLRVSKSGFVDGYRSLQLAEGERKEDVNFTLVEGLQITGRLITLEGKPIADARVRAVPHKYVPGRDETLTDKLGNYVLKNLGRGLFDVRANFPLKTPDGEQNYEFFRLDVKAGTTNLEIECDVNNSAVGTVEGEDNRPVDNFHIRLRSRRDTSPKQDFIFNLDRDCFSARGFFRIVNIPRGIYSFTLTAEGYEVFQNENLVIGPSRRTVIPKIRLKQAGGVIGYVYSSETDRPINDVTVRLANPEKTEEEARQTALTARTDYSGFFRVGTAAAGTYVLELEHPNYISSRIDQVVVRQRGTTDLGRIYLEAGGSVQGVVLDEDGYGVNWAKVRVSGVYPTKETRTNSFGNYLLLGVRPGRWPLVVEANVSGRRVYVFRPVDIVAGETSEQNFQLETSANVVGSVVSGQGVVRSGTVHLQPFDEYGNVIEDIRYDGGLTNAQFRINSVPPGQYFAWSTGYGPASSYAVWQTAYLQRGENRMLFELPTSYVAGKASNAAGAGVAGVAVQLMPVFDGFGVPRNVYYSLVRKATTNSSGDFIIGHVMSGSHQLLYFDSSLVGGGQWLALPSFWIGPGQQLRGITLQLGN
ncbi:MAG: carboxypeptidase regulatory-like domain-containing protein [Candidatus Sumerlaeaceae bacterium]